MKFIITFAFLALAAAIPLPGAWESFVTVGDAGPIFVRAPEKKVYIFTPTANLKHVVIEFAAEHSPVRIVEIDAANTIVKDFFEPYDSWTPTVGMAPFASSVFTENAHLAYLFDIFKGYEGAVNEALYTELLGKVHAGILAGHVHEVVYDILSSLYGAPAAAAAAYGTHAAGALPFYGGKHWSSPYAFEGPWSSYYHTGKYNYPSYSKYFYPGSYAAPFSAAHYPGAYGSPFYNSFSGFTGPYASSYYAGYGDSSYGYPGYSSSYSPYGYPWYSGHSSYYPGFSKLSSFYPGYSSYYPEYSKYSSFYPGHSSYSSGYGYPGYSKYSSFYPGYSSYSSGYGYPGYTGYSSFYPGYSSYSSGYGYPGYSSYGGYFPYSSWLSKYPSFGSALTHL